MKDVFGRDILVGDFIAYSRVACQSSELAVGVVSKVIGGVDHKISVKGFSQYHLTRIDFNEVIPMNSTFSSCACKCVVISPNQIPPACQQHFETIRKKILYESTESN